MMIIEPPLGAKVSETFYAGAQISPADVAQLAQAGFTAIVCSRPDGEEEGQPSSDDMAAAAAEHGLQFHYIPITPGEFGDDSIARFAAARQQAAGPVFGYCRTGARAVTSDALANIENRSADERMEAARAAGFDIAERRTQLEQS